ncbi:hypothetical protein V7S43_015266 [Phytophthora oleae]|uniref:Uncharacterized protein n=1 Tax=Phytophthora oleae TaxID=2107226 RepID=A0ABD3EYR9_9STRA
MRVGPASYSRGADARGGGCTSDNTEQHHHRRVRMRSSSGDPDAALLHPADACKLRIVRENFIKLFFEQQVVTCSHPEEFARHEATTRKVMAFTSIFEEESRVTAAGGDGVAKCPWRLRMLSSIQCACSKLEVCLRI